MTDAGRLNWINYDEAMDRVRGFGDPAREQFVMRAVTLVVLDAQQGNGPAVPLDMLYFVDVQSRLFEQRDSLIRVLQGEDLRWWGDDK